MRLTSKITFVLNEIRRKEDFLVSRCTHSHFISRYLWRIRVLPFACKAYSSQLVRSHLDIQNWRRSERKGTRLPQHGPHQVTPKLKKKACCGRRTISRNYHGDFAKVLAQKGRCSHEKLVLKLEWVHRRFLQSWRSDWSCSNLHEQSAIKPKYFFYNRTWW